jgi:hypothetical protein
MIDEYAAVGGMNLGISPVNVTFKGEVEHLLYALQLHTAP